MSMTSPSGNHGLGALAPPSIYSASSPSPSFSASRPRSPSDTPSGEFDGSNTNGQVADVDPQILEALKSKDRLYVLKLGELMEGLINERRSRVDLNPATTYQRLLVHRCSAYYRLAPESDPTTKSISVLPTAESRIPIRRLSELVPAEATVQPAFKIMRRTLNDRTRPKPQSQAGSVTGEDADLSDVEPSESGSLGSRSNATGGSKKRLTIEEREAAYNEARSRIFMGFEEKDKDKDMSASSSTLSLVSGSASTSGGGGGSSVGDLDDSVGSPATESEWSGPAPREKKGELRRGGSGGDSTTSSQRSLRSGAVTFNASGSGSSRGSRAPSPAFQYASLYEPPTASSSPYDPSQMPGQGPAPGYMAQYIYPYPMPGQAPPQGYIAPYSYYAYPYPPQNSMPTSDPAGATGGDPYIHSQQHPPQHVAYVNPYVWPHAHQPPLPPPAQHTPPSGQHQPAMHGSPTQNTPQQQYQIPFVPAPYPPYPMPGYYQQPPPPQASQPQNHPQPMPPPLPHMPGQQPFSNEVPRMMNGNRNGNASMGSGPSFNRTNSNPRQPLSAGGINGDNKRGAPPARTAWSYGPGIGMSGFTGTIGNNGMGGGDVVGPRLSSSMRRTSGTSSAGSGSTGNRTPAGDEASSVASSSTSSSSRRTFTSATSSHHPLPARPDWAVGMKPEPTLHATHNRHHDNALSNSRNMSPARNNNQMQSSNIPPPQSQPQQIPPILLQSTDFPPLTAVSPSPEKRTPVIGGAWTNPSSTRSVFMPNPGHASSHGNALVHHPTSLLNGSTVSSNARLDEPDRGFERPPPKGNTELFNPKGVVRSPSNNSKSPQNTPDKAEKERQERERVRGEAVATAILADRIESVSLEDQDGERTRSASLTASPAAAI